LTGTNKQRKQLSSLTSQSSNTPVSSRRIADSEISCGDYADNSLSGATFDACLRLDKWLTVNGWAGYDPYDICGTSWYIRMASWQSVPLRVLRKVPLKLIEWYPQAARRVAVRRAINPKGMGLLVAAYCRLYQATEDTAYLEKAEKCADWLLANTDKTDYGMGWGYPFDWQSVIFIPKGTPSVVVSTAVGEGLWLLHELTGKDRYLDACVEICHFILQGLNRTELDENTLCFSYTPLDHFLVHNANLFAAEFLARVGGQIGRREWSDIAVRAGNYFLLEQNDDGSVFYWGRVQNQNAPNHRDCYHSGFEIRSLWGLWKATGDLRFHKAALKYFDFFEESYLRDDGAVMNLPGAVFPVDIHACAEALLCPTTMSEAFPERFVKIICRTLPWIIKLMQNGDGSFAYIAYENGRVDRTPYLRWGQAWMLRALAELQFVVKQRSMVSNAPSGRGAA
jgi:rhamnogalacturonyl hydrolase YesR